MRGGIGKRLPLLAALAVSAVAGGWLYIGHRDRWMPPGPPEEAGRVLFSYKRCIRCHRVGGDGGIVGPDLTAVASRRPPGWMESYLRDPKAVKPDARMPRPKLTSRQREALLAYLATLDGRPSLPPHAAGAQSP